MKRFMGITGVLVVVLGLGLSSASAARRGAVRGVVAGTDVWRDDAGRIMLSVTVQAEGDRRETFSVGPGNRQGYTTVGTLRKGERVVVGWVAEGDRKWIREIGRLEGEREEGERERRDEPAAHREREGDERAERRERERDEPAEGERDVNAERLRRVERELAEIREKLERAERTERERDRRTERERDERPEQEERRPVARREGGDRDRERTPARRHRMKGTVVSTALGDADADRPGLRVLKVRKLEGDDVITFTVGPDRRELYKIVGGFERGDRVIVVWTSEGEHTRLREIGRID